MRHGEGAEWLPFVWKAIEKDSDFGCSLIESVCYQTGPASKLTESEATAPELLRDQKVIVMILLETFIAAQESNQRDLMIGGHAVRDLVVFHSVERRIS